MNPGTSWRARRFTEHLRYGTTYKTWEPKTLLDFSAQGGFAAAVEMCNGVGVCRKKLEGTMCPSYMATRDEEHSTRGRANALRAVLSGKVPAEDFAGQRLYEVMDLCLECKGCKAECPSNVDMAKLKYEFLHHYYAVNGLPRRNRLFGHIAKLSAWGSRRAGVQLDRGLVAEPAPDGTLFGIDRAASAAGVCAARPSPSWFDARKPRRERRAGASSSSTTPS